MGCHRLFHGAPVRRAFREARSARIPRHRRPVGAFTYNDGTHNGTADDEIADVCQGHCLDRMLNRRHRHRRTCRAVVRGLLQTAEHSRRSSTRRTLRHNPRHQRAPEHDPHPPGRGPPAGRRCMSKPHGVSPVDLQAPVGNRAIVSADAGVNGVAINLSQRLHFPINHRWSVNDLLRRDSHPSSTETDLDTRHRQTPIRVRHHTIHEETSTRVPTSCAGSKTDTRTASTPSPLIPRH